MSSSAARVTVLVGRGRYEDPWHDHAATGHLVAVEALALGHRTQLRSLVPGAVQEVLAAGPDVVVVNAGSGRVDPGFDGTDDDWAPDHAALADWADGGGALLGLHCAANTFADAPQWERLLGGRWVPGTSWHPPFGEARLTPVPGHPVARALLDGDGDGGGGDGGVVARDERYCGLVVGAASVPLLTHVEGGCTEVAAWAVDDGGRRAVYDGLGHCVESYASRSRVRLLGLELGWLLGTA